MTSSKYFEETLFNAIVIASRLVMGEEKAKVLLEISLELIKLTLKNERPDIGLNLCKAMERLLDRFHLDSQEISYCFGMCHFNQVRLIEQH